MVRLIKPFHQLIDIRYLWVLVLLFAVACNRPDPKAPGHSAAFKKLQGQVDTLFGTNRVEDGLRLLDSAAKNMTELTLDDQYRAYALHYVYYKNTLGDAKRALPYADSMLRIAKLNTDHKQYVDQFVDANLAMGDAYFSLEQYDEAYQHLFQGYLVGKNNLSRVALSDYSYRMGMISYKMGNYHLAKDYFKKAYEYHEIKPNDFVNFYRVQELLDNIALSYKHASNADSALYYFDKSLTFINKYGPQFKDRLKMIEMARGVVYGNKAEIFIAEGNHQKAIALLKQSIAINLQKDYDNNDAVLSQIKLAEIYNTEKKDTELITLLNDVAALQKTVKNPEAEADWHRLMSRYYERKKDLQKSINHLHAYIAVRDSNLHKLTLLKESDINKKIDNFEKQQQIDQLSSDNRMQTISLYVAAVISFLTLVILFLIYRNWRRSKRDIKTVNLLNKQINEQNADLEIALNELKLSSQEKDRILRTVAHDLRNPLGGIASLSSLMAAEDFSDEQKELIDLIKQTSYNSLELINEIMEATNINSIQLNPEPAEINSLVNNSVELLRFKALEKGQQIFFEPLKDSLELVISREKIWRVISNLISNAIKFSPSGAPINVKVVKDSAQVVISVQDSGIGIPEKMKDQVFNMFTAAQRPGTAGEKSFGLGLSICRQIMEKSGGKIWFYSRKQGTTFFISLPINNQNKPEADLSEQISVPQA